MVRQCWKLLSRMAKKAENVLAAPTEAPAVAQARLRVALLDGAVQHLGGQQRELIESAVKEHREAAGLGGSDGTEFFAAAKLRLEGLSVLGGGAGAGAMDAEVTLDDGRSTPLWQTVFWSLRCDDAKAARRVMERAAEQQVASPASWRALLALVSSLDPEASSPNPAMSDLIAKARQEYWANGAPTNRALAGVYSVLCAPEPLAKLEELMPTLELTIETWLWHRLCMVRVQLLDGGGASAGGSAASSSSQPLAELQRLLYELLGEAHFNKTKDKPLLFTSVLMHSLQLERALAYLYTDPRYADEAFHLALACHHAGLISITTQPTSASDGLMLEQSVGATQPPQLCLSNMLEHQVSTWAREDGVTALEYVFLLRGPTAITEHLGVRLLVQNEATDVLLTSMPFLPPQTQRRLMEETAVKLHTERGMPTHAARLLFSCQSFPALASLLLEILSDAILAAPAVNPTVGAPMADPAAEAHATSLIGDATNFLAKWKESDAAGAAAHGSALERMLDLARLLYIACEWRRQRATQGGEAALTAVIQQLHALPMLPRSPVEVDSKQADFRQLPRQLQRLVPPLLLSAMEAVHAKFNALRRAPHAAALIPGAGAGAELRELRERAEALVAFGGMSVWWSTDTMGHTQLPPIASQQLASWLSDMA
jgi:hypothetical protein